MDRGLLQLLWPGRFCCVCGGPRYTGQISDDTVQQLRGILHVLTIILKTLFIEQLRGLSAVRPPCDDSPTVFHGSKCERGSTNRLHPILKLLVHAAAVTPAHTAAPCDDCTTSCQCSKCSPGGEHANYVAQQKPLNRATVTTNGSVTPCDHATVVRDTGKSTLSSIDLHYISQLGILRTTKAARGFRERTATIRVTPSNDGTIGLDRCECHLCCMDALDIASEFFCDFFAVTTSTRIAPCNHSAIILQSTEGSSRGTNHLHTT
mmetsp:Transcript_22539/g.51597  ORF Transcript_22539/g.51597 Transcript_22539/m.51597 type:complete len:263 (-) Transcript_22539:833-1621(-)